MDMVEYKNLKLWTKVIAAIATFPAVVIAFMVLRLVMNTVDPYNTYHLVVGLILGWTYPLIFGTFLVVNSAIQHLKFNTNPTWPCVIAVLCFLAHLIPYFVGLMETSVLMSYVANIVLAFFTVFFTVYTSVHEEEAAK